MLRKAWAKKLRTLSPKGGAGLCRKKTRRIFASLWSLFHLPY